MGARWLAGALLLLVWAARRRAKGPCAPAGLERAGSKKLCGGRGAGVGRVRLQFEVGERCWGVGRAARPASFSDGATVAGACVQLANKSPIAPSSA